MAFRLKIEGYDLVVFEDGAPETEYISNPTAVTVAKFTDATHVQFYDYSQKIDGGRDPFLLGEENNSFVITSLIDNTTGIAFTSVASFKTFIRGKIGYFSSCSSGGSGVQSVTGDGVDNTDPLNPILSFPDADEVDDTSTTNKFATQPQLDQIATNTSDISGKRDTTAQKNSIEDDSGDLQLVNDAASPGNSQYYGTDSSGVKGWQAMLNFNVDLDSTIGSVSRVVGGGRTTFTITHNLNTFDLIVQVFRLSDGRGINLRIERTGVNTIEASRAGTVADGLFRILIKG